MSDVAGRFGAQVSGTWQAQIFLAYASEDKKLAVAAKAAVEDYATEKQQRKISVTSWSLAAELSTSLMTVSFRITQTNVTLESFSIRQWTGLWYVNQSALLFGTMSSLRLACLLAERA